MASTDFSNWVICVNCPVRPHSPPHTLDLTGLALCQLGCQKPYETSGVRLMGRLGREHVSPSRIPINCPRLSGNIIVCIAVCTVLISNAE